MNNHERYMQRCIDLAEQGLGHTAPNPMVGCVIVHEGKIIGEGYHKIFGGAHAEVNAINDAIEKSYTHLLPESSLYVSLEPCSHYGKTPPCADLIISKKIPHIVIGMKDPNPLVAGKGIQKLKEAGSSVTVGVLEKECRILNKRFLSHYEKHRPYIILKWAQTKDGFMALPDRQKKQISNELSRELLHKWRSEEQAILVGHNTALYDNPELNVRYWKGKNPLRCVIDEKLNLPASLHIFDKKISTVVFNSIKEEKQSNLHFVKISFDYSLIKQLLIYLHSEKIQSVIVEGGIKTLQSFIDNALWDEARIFISNDEWREGIKAPEINLPPTSIETIEDNQLKMILNNSTV